MLNMLLSFAQFEREVTAERIRDKIAASKAKGMWMGGIPPLGYEPDGRSLKIVEDHAAIVRRVFSRYLELGNVRLTQEALVNENVRVPVRSTRDGKAYGGGHLSRGQIYTILKNPIYIGRIAHKDETFDGQHEAIIDDDIWQQVQAKLNSNTAGKRHATRRNTSLLAGLLFMPDGGPLVAVHSTKGVKRYRYYVSRTYQLGTSSGEQSTRMPAPELERFVLQEIQSSLANPLPLIEQLGACAFTQWITQGRHATETRTVSSNDITKLVCRIVFTLIGSILSSHETGSHTGSASKSIRKGLSQSCLLCLARLNERALRSA